jgi:cytochrome c5
MSVDVSGRRISRPFAITALAAVAIAVCAVASAQTKERSGKEIVDSLCVSCHGAGANGAPKIGDKKAWAARAEKGLSGLTKSAMQGIRQMPAHGGNPKLTDTEIERAITYMVNQSGGHWTEPVSRVSKTPDRTGKEIVETQCVKCHGTGVNGAPKIGDRAAWTPRVKQGLDVVVSSAIHGHGAMPPRGGMADLTDAEIRSAIVYMFNAGTGAKN